MAVTTTIGNVVVAPLAGHRMKRVSIAAPDRIRAPAFATPYEIFIVKQYGASIPLELDEAARIDGATPLQIYRPLMAPVLVAIGTYALLLPWNEYLYAFLLLSSDANIIVTVGLGKFLNSDEAP
jgi:multiple sugar transport system permease protein